MPANPASVTHARRQRIWKLYISGYKAARIRDMFQEEVAEHNSRFPNSTEKHLLDVELQTIHRDIAYLRKHYTVENTEEAKQSIIEMNRDVMARLYDNFSRSGSLYAADRFFKASQVTSELLGVSTSKSVDMDINVHLSDEADS